MSRGRRSAAVEAALGGGDGHVAGRHLGRGVPALADAGALDDPLGVAAQRGEVLVRHDVVGHEAARADDLHAGQASHGRSADRRVLESLMEGTLQAGRDREGGQAGRRGAKRARYAFERRAARARGGAQSRIDAGRKREG